MTGEIPLKKWIDASGNVLGQVQPEARALMSRYRNASQGVDHKYYQMDCPWKYYNSLSNSAGALANTYTYDSFGKLNASAGTLTNPFQFTGREFDPETGVYNYRMRYYDQNTRPVPQRRSNSVGGWYRFLSLC